MDKETLRLVGVLLPKIPLIFRVSLLHVLRLSAPAKYLDLRTAVIVSVLRSLIAPSRPLSISQTQRLTLKDPGIKGRIWVSNYATSQPPETGVRDVLLAAVNRLNSAADPPLQARTPDLVPVEAEWTGYRAAAQSKSTLPSISEKEKYVELMKECKSPVTVLYFHGGAYYLLDPASHRPTTKRLAKLTGGRCYSVRYRLAPQNPFPAALLDALVSYLTLLYPPPDAFHEPVDPKHIVFAGDRYVL
ncbi:alpha/beta hydrolase fold domain-containing protein [Candidatus Bathyarchaeota archaeon]|nr:alpha/beta hydrolase fold domain-containing protein [Candidatus Bathyarchaeota archaeon]